jgi:cytochrome c oxidase assembly protein subunit 11
VSPALPVIESPHEEWRLVRAGGRWWVDLDWAGAVSVRFDGVALGGLPWRFEPAQREVRAHPGETLQVTYRLTNPTAQAETGKARHVVTPGGDGVLDIVTCFCFLEQTLQPGQTVELPVVFRVPYDAPEALRQIHVRYEFYPAATFPDRSPS